MQAAPGWAFGVEQAQLELPLPPTSPTTVSAWNRPADLQGQPALGAFDAADPLVELMNRKLMLMRRKHAQTREDMEMNALRGILKDGAGSHVIHGEPLRDRERLIWTLDLRPA